MEDFDLNLKYAICIKDIEIVQVPDFMQVHSNLKCGSLVNIIYYIGDIVVFKVLLPKQGNDVYKCKSVHLKQISVSLFKIMLGVRQEVHRAKIINDPLFLDYVVNLKTNQIVMVPPRRVGNQRDIRCEIRYIGPVTQIGPGTFFGFFILDPTDSIEARGTLAPEYLNCDNTRGFLRSIEVLLRGEENARQMNRSTNRPMLSRNSSMESVSSGSSRGRINFVPAVKVPQIPVKPINFQPVKPNAIHSNVNQLFNFGPNMAEKSNIHRQPQQSKPINFVPAQPSTSAANPKYQPPIQSLLSDLRQSMVKFIPITQLATNVMRTVIQGTSNNNPQASKYDAVAQLDMLQAKVRELQEQAAQKQRKHNDRPTVSRPIKFTVIPSGSVATIGRPTPPSSHSAKRCLLRECPRNNPRKRFRDVNVKWRGDTLIYTSTHLSLSTCDICHHDQLECLFDGYTSTEFKEFTDYLEMRNIPMADTKPQNRYLLEIKKSKDKWRQKQMTARYSESTKFEIGRNRHKTNCAYCSRMLASSQGIALKACGHIFCKVCLKMRLETFIETGGDTGTTTTVKCPFKNEVYECQCTLDDREIEAIVPLELYTKLMDRRRTVVVMKSHAAIESPKTVMILRCNRNECQGWVNVDLKNDRKYYACPICQMMMCRVCQTSHPGLTCRAHMARTNSEVHEAIELDLDWVCETCTFINVNDNVTCDSCGQKSTYAYDLIDNDDDDEDEFGCVVIDDNDEASLVDYDVEDVANQYDQLLALEDMDLIRNTEKFECVICFCDCDPGAGVKLRECLHEFCPDCLADQIRNSLGATVACPFSDDRYSCECTLQDREIKGLVPIEVFEQYLMRSLREAQGKLGDGFQCKTPDCDGFWCHDEFITAFRCQLCNQINCHQCRAIHEGISCREYQDKVFNDRDPAAIQTKKMLEDLMRRGEAMKCPTCEVIIARTEGCSWILCIMCKTEICWATRGPRWGPKGKGDTSGGCGCDFLNKKPCHKDCEYCH